MLCGGASDWATVSCGGRGEKRAGLLMGVVSVERPVDGPGRLSRKSPRFISAAPPAAGGRPATRGGRPGRAGRVRGAGSRRGALLRGRDDRLDRRRDAVG